jgi:photosystem II stability/assembly factor-like uncharacterized protein
MKKITFLFIILFLSTAATRAQWTTQNAGFTNKTLGFYEISIVDQNVVWAICYDGVGGLMGPAVVLDFTRTTDGGATWTPGWMGSDSSLAFSNICALSSTEAWVAMHHRDLSPGGGLFHTTDGGVTWSQSNAGTIFDSNSFPNFVHFKNTLEGVAVGDANGGYFEIYTTTDGGNTWTRTPQASIPNFVAGGGYGWFDGYAVLGDTIWFGTAGGEMYKSTDFGLTWSVSTVSPAGYTVYEIAFNDDGQHGLTHVRSSSATFLFATSDGGATWTQRPSHSKWKQSKITSVPGTNMFVSTSMISSNKGSSVTTDHGVTWIQIEGTGPKAACRFLNSTTGWAGGFTNPNATTPGGMYKWNNTNPLSITESNDNTTQAVVYPSPATDKLNIEFSNDGLAYDLQFYNTLGMLVKELDNAASREIDIADLPNGIYFIRSKNDPGVNMKFIKE